MTANNGFHSDAAAESPIQVEETSFSDGSPSGPIASASVADDPMMIHTQEIVLQLNDPSINAGEPLH